MAKGLMTVDDLLSETWFYATATEKKVTVTGSDAEALNRMRRDEWAAMTQDERDKLARSRGFEGAAA